MVCKEETWYRRGVREVIQIRSKVNNMINQNGVNIVCP